MKIIKETSFKVVGMYNYNGVCDACQTPIEYLDELIIIVVQESEKVDVVIPVDRLVCPNCLKEIRTMTIYKDMDITQELKELKK